MKYVLLTQIPSEGYEVDFYDTLKEARKTILIEREYNKILIKAKEIIGIPIFK